MERAGCSKVDGRNRRAVCPSASISRLAAFEAPETFVAGCSLFPGVPTDVQFMRHPSERMPIKVYICQRSVDEKQTFVVFDGRPRRLQRRGLGVPGEARRGHAVGSRRREISVREFPEISGSDLERL